MDTTQWAQGIGLLRKPMEEELLHPSSSSFLPTTTAAAAAAVNSAARAAAPAIPQQSSAERKARPQKEQALHCPRCNSTNTKFCYYNNYSLTQPRYFCKACRRYWTEGGSLRNVPVGGGSRKNKRHSSSSSSNPSSNTNPAASSSTMIKNINPPPPPPPPPMSLSSNQQFDQVHDLNLTFPNHNSFQLNLDSNGGGGTGGLSAMELLRSSGITARGLGPLVPMPMSMSMPPESMYPYDGGVGAGGMQEGGRRLLFPFGDMKQEQQHRGQGGGGGEPPMFWNGMMGGGGNGSSW